MKAQLLGADYLLWAAVGLALGWCLARFLLKVGHLLGGTLVGFRLIVAAIGPWTFNPTETGLKARFQPHKTWFRFILGMGPKRVDTPASSFLFERAAGPFLMALGAIGMLFWQDSSYEVRTVRLYALAALVYLCIQAGWIGPKSVQTFYEGFSRPGVLDVYRARRVIVADPVQRKNKELLDLACRPVGSPKVIAVMINARADYYAARKEWDAAWKDIERILNTFSRAETNYHIVRMTAAVIAAQGLDNAELARHHWSRVDPKHLPASDVALAEALVLLAAGNARESLAAIERCEKSLPHDVWRSKQGTEEMWQTVSEVRDKAQAMLT